MNKLLVILITVMFLSICSDKRISSLDESYKYVNDIDNGLLICQTKNGRIKGKTT